MLIIRYNKILIDIEELETSILLHAGEPSELLVARATLADLKRKRDIHESLMEGTQS